MLYRDSPRPRVIGCTFGPAEALIAMRFFCVEICSLKTFTVAYELR